MGKDLYGIQVGAGIGGARTHVPMRLTDEEASGIAKLSTKLQDTASFDSSPWVTITKLAPWQQLGTEDDE
jgi:hypothetical protein